MVRRTLKEKPNPFEGKDGFWYWYNEALVPSIPYLTKQAAKEGLNNYIVWLQGGCNEGKTCEGNKYS